MNTSTLSAEILIKIGIAVFELWPGKLKSRGEGRVYSSRRVYSAKYSINQSLLHVEIFTEVYKLYTSVKYLNNQ